MTIIIDTEAIEIFPDTVQSLRLDAAGVLIASSSRWSVIAALIPLPYADMAALAAIQSKLVIDLSLLYEKSASKEVVTGAISVLLATLIPVGAAQATAKFFPGIGTIIGTVSLAAFGSAATYSVGKVFVRHFEHGGNLTDLSVKKLQADLKKEFIQVASKKIN